MPSRPESPANVRRTSRRLGRQVTVPEVIQKVEGLHRVYPPVEGIPSDELIDLLGPWKKGGTVIYSNI